VTTKEEILEVIRRLTDGVTLPEISSD